MKSRLAAAAIGLSIASGATSADASGMYTSERGVRPLGRGGAFVAGADDLGAVAYNPAGLADAGSSLLLDASWGHVSTGFTRRGIVEDNARNRSVITFPKVTGTTPFIPVPTIAGSYSPSLLGHMFTFA